MEDKADMLSERLLDYGVEIVKLVASFERTTAGRHIAGQLLRSGTSVGANYEEASRCARESRFRPQTTNRYQRGSGILVLAKTGGKSWALERIEPRPSSG